MINWIECNLPYSYYYDSWSVSKELEKKYQCSCDYFYNKLEKELNLKWEIEKDQFFSEEELSLLNTVNRKWLHCYSNYLPQKYHDAFKKWHDSQKEYTDYLERRKEYELEKIKLEKNHKNNFKSFIHNCPNEPGILFQLEDGAYHLIGSVIKDGILEQCQCQDRYNYIHPREIVIRYAKVFDLGSLDE